MQNKASFYYLTIIVPNFGDAWFGRKSVEEAVLHESGLLSQLLLSATAHKLTENTTSQSDYNN